jgi:hypothetical protein
MRRFFLQSLCSDVRGCGQQRFEAAHQQVLSRRLKAAEEGRLRLIGM